MVKRFKGLFIISVILFSTAVGFAETKIWVGGDSSKPTDWDTPANWSPSGVPTSSDEVVINSGGNQPVIENQVTWSDKTVEIKKLEVKTGATLKIIANERDLEFKGASDFLIQGQIILELKRGTTRYIKISDTDFIGSSRIFIDGPSSGFNSDYHTNLEASGNINFKPDSIITAGTYANDDRLIINSPSVAIAGSCVVDSKLEIKNTYDSTGLNIKIDGSLVANQDFTIPNSTNTKIRSSGYVTLIQGISSLNNADWIASNGTITTKGHFRVPNFKQTYGSLNLAGGGTQNLNIEQAYNLKIESLSTTSLRVNIKILNSFDNKASGIGEGTAGKSYRLVRISIEGTFIVKRI